MIVVAKRHVMVLLERFEVLRGRDLGGERLLVRRHWHLYVHELLLLLEVDGVHGRLLWVLAKAQSSHRSVESGLTIVEAGELKIRLEVEKLGEVVVANLLVHWVVVHLLWPSHRALLVPLWHCRLQQGLSGARRWAAEGDSS